MILLMILIVRFVVDIKPLLSVIMAGAVVTMLCALHAG
jgi:hypothetical protein